MRFLKILAAIILILVVVYLFGPNPATPVYTKELPMVPDSAKALEAYVNTIESAHKIKPNNQARIVWINDSTKAQTEYAMLYLHGFSASQEEGNPVHRDIAKKFECNLYLARLSQHGIDTTEEMQNLTPENYWESTKQAFAIAKKLGKKVIVMSTSTGGTLALKLAAEFPELAALVLISPNIAINDDNAKLLNNPWGLQIARLVKKGNYNVVENCKLPEYAKYWNCKYRLEAIVALEELIETTMVPAIFNAIKQPVLTLAYYKNEKEQDPVVKVSAMEEMITAIATSTEKKKLVKMPNTGNHVQGNPILSKDVEGVKREIADFLQNALQLKAVL